MLTYATGPASSGASLDEALRAALEATTFSGEGGGAHPTGLAAWMSYAADYRPVFLVLAAIPVVLFFGGFVVMARRSKPNYEDF